MLSLLALAVAGQIQIAVPDSGRPTIEPPSSADIRAIARPDLGADALARGRAQAEAMAASAEALSAQHRRQESETLRLQCIAARRKAELPVASCTR